MRTDIKYLVFISLFFKILFHPHLQACELNKKIISLSGPFTMVLEELELLNDKNLFGISVFNPIDTKTNVKVYSGGLFLPKKVIQNEFSGKLVVLDDSRELNQLFMKSGIETYALKTNGLNSFENTYKLLDVARSLTKKCQQKIKALKKKVSKIEQNLKTKWLHKKTIFFLGEISSKLPELIMVNDGPMKFLIDYNLTKTYPSKLSYVNWSQKLLMKMNGYKKFGLTEEPKNKRANNEITYTKINDYKFNLYFRGVLIPGIRQVYFLEKLNDLSLN